MVFKRLLPFFSLLFPVFLTAQINTDSLHRVLLKVEDSGKLPGFAVGIIQGDSIVFQQGYGYADLEGEKPMSVRHIQNIGSVSKTFIAVAMMKAIEDGHFQLDDPVNQYLPFEVLHPKFPDQPITFRHLATHTSGIRDSRNYFRSYVQLAPLPELESTYSKKQLRELKQIRDNVRMPYGEFLEAYLKKGGNFYLKKNFGKKAPGESYEYSNVGAALLAFAVEEALGEDFMEYSYEKITRPLGMENSGWAIADVDYDWHSELYYPNGARVPVYTLNTWPDGGMISSCADLTLYLREMMAGYRGEGTLLSSESYRQMFDLQFDGEEKVGLIWAFNRYGQIEHNGADPGIFTYIQFDPEEHTGQVVVTNCSAHEGEEQLAAFIEIWRAAYDYRKYLFESNP